MKISDKGLLWGLVCLAGIGTAAAGAQPTGIAWWDTILSFLFGASITLVSVRASHGAINVFAGLMVAVSNGSLALIPGLLGLLTSLGAIVGFAPGQRRRQSRAARVVAGALTAQTAIRLPPIGPFGTQSLIVLAALLGLFITAYRRATANEQHWARRGSTFGLIVIVTITLTFAGVALSARSRADEGSRAANRGLAAVRNGDTELLVTELERAQSSLSQLSSSMDGPLAAPARLVPILSQHQRAISVSAQEGASIAQQLVVMTEEAGFEDLELSARAIDLTTFPGMSERLDDVLASVQQAQLSVQSVSSPWLLPLVSERLGSLTNELADAEPDLELAAAAARSLPALLGGEIPQRYLVAFANPAEAREMGGFIASYALIEADNGTLRMIDSGSRLGLQPYARAGSLDHPDGYPARYLEANPVEFPTNLTALPDPETVGRAAIDLFDDIQGAPLDGFIYVDPFAVAAMLEITGPITVDGQAGQLDSSNAAEFLTNEQYAQFDAQLNDPEDREARFNALFGILDATFDALQSTDLPGPERLGAILGPAARQGRLQVITDDPVANDFLRQVRLLNDFPQEDGGDFLAVLHSNGASNKLDALLQRNVSYQVSVDESTRAISASLTVTLTSMVPADSPEYVLGRDTEETRPGENLVMLSIYTPHRAEFARINGVDTDVALYEEFGYSRYVIPVLVPPNASVDVTLELEGAIAGTPSDDYTLTMASQPLVNADQVDVVVRTTERETDVTRSFELIEDMTLSFSE